MRYRSQRFNRNFRAEAHATGDICNWICLEFLSIPHLTAGCKQLEKLKWGIMQYYIFV